MRVLLLEKFSRKFVYIVFGLVLTPLISIGWYVLLKSFQGSLFKAGLAIPWIESLFYFPVIFVIYVTIIIIRKTDGFRNSFFHGAATFLIQVTLFGLSSYFCIVVYSFDNAFYPQFEKISSRADEVVDAIKRR